MPVGLHPGALLLIIVPKVGGGAWGLPGHQRPGGKTKGLIWKSVDDLRRKGAEWARSPTAKKRQKGGRG